MKFFNLLFSVMILGCLTLTSCQSEKADNVTESAEAAVEGAANKIDNAVSPVAAKNEAAVPAGPTTSMKFDDTTYDFGTITDGDKVRHSFKFTNTGTEPLIISNCKGSCGCTVPVCPKDPIAPGEGGEITVEYNSRGKSKGGTAEGKPDSKFVNVTANTEPAASRLTIKANVMPDPKAPKADAKK